MISKKVKLTILLSFLMIFTFNAYSKSFKFSPTLSVIESYTYFQNYTKLNVGVFEMTNRPLNFGVELTQKIPLDSIHFLRIGLRYQSFKKNVYGLNQIEELYDFPHPLNWEYGYTAFTVPIHFGKEYTINKTKRGDYYFGLSIGVLMTSFSKINSSNIPPKSSMFLDPVLVAIVDEGELANYFFPNFEVGINYLPLKKFKRLSIGFNASIQLNKTAYSKHQGWIIVPTLSRDYFYDMYNQNKVINTSINLGFTF